MKVIDLVKPRSVGKILSAFHKTEYGFPAYQITVEKLVDRGQAYAHAHGTGPLTAAECRKIAETFSVAADFIDVLNKVETTDRKDRKQFYANGAK